MTVVAIVTIICATDILAMRYSCRLVAIEASNMYSKKRFFGVVHYIGVTTTTEGDYNFFYKQALAGGALTAAVVFMWNINNINQSSAGRAFLALANCTHNDRNMLGRFSQHHEKVGQVRSRRAVACGRL